MPLSLERITLPGIPILSAGSLSGCPAVRDGQVRVHALCPGWLWGYLWCSRWLEGFRSYSRHASDWYYLTGG
ncbi:MAG: hypothetical protein HDR88_01970 [Bacteroides sp.]|nr:hypothetical protein [Bacteroides sp.]